MTQGYLAGVRALAVTVVLLVLAGCGGDDGTTPEDAVRDVVNRFGTASAKKDYQAICDDLLARSLTDNVEEFGLPCELAFKRGLAAVRKPKLVIRSVRVDGTTARVRVRTTAVNQKASEDTLTLRLADGEWRITALR